MNTRVPVIDVSGFDGSNDEASRGVELLVGEACENIGFLVVEGHGVTDSVIGNMRSVSSQLFDLEMSHKMAVRGDHKNTLGYTPPLMENLAATRNEEVPADLKEIFDIRRPDIPTDEYYTSPTGRYFFRENLWPESVPGFRAAWTEYYLAMEELARKMMRIFAGALNVRHDFFESSMSHSVDYLRAINYPAQTEAPLPGQLRAGAHTDYGTLTLLLTDDAPGGLEVLGRGGSWLSVPHVPGGYVVNIGDMMAQWTNGRWISTVHRVVNPGESVRASSRRMSIPFFQNPNYDALIEAIPSCVPAGEKPHAPAFIAGEWLRQKQERQRVKA